MNRGELRAAVLSRLGVPPAGDGMLDANTVDGIVQRALTDMSNERTWPWLLTSGALTFTADSAPMPDDCVLVRDFTVDGRRARRVKFTEWLNEQSIRTGHMWTDVGATIRISPTPAVALTSPVLWYYRNEPTLVTEGQSPLAPGQYHTYVIARASYHANVRRSRMEEAARDLAEWQDGVRHMWDAVSRQTGPSKIREARPQVWAVW
jgi:hypothetical protein